MAKRHGLINLARQRIRQNPDLDATRRQQGSHSGALPRVLHQPAHVCLGPRPQRRRQRQAHPACVQPVPARPVPGSCGFSPRSHAPQGGDQPGMAEGITPRGSRPESRSPAGPLFRSQTEQNTQRALLGHLPRHRFLELQLTEATGGEQSRTHPIPVHPNRTIGGMRHPPARKPRLQVQFPAANGPGGIPRPRPGATRMTQQLMTAFKGQGHGPRLVRKRAIRRQHQPGPATDGPRRPPRFGTFCPGAPDPCQRDAQPGSVRPEHLQPPMAGAPAIPWRTQRNPSVRPAGHVKPPDQGKGLRGHRLCRPARYEGWERAIRV